MRHKHETCIRCATSKLSETHCFFEAQIGNALPLHRATMSGKIRHLVFALLIALIGSAHSERACAELSHVPRFADFPAEKPFVGKSRPLVLDSKFALMYRTRLREALRHGKPDFAGRYIVTRWGCGSSRCNEGAAIDAATGRAVQMPGALVDVWPMRQDVAQGQELIYRLSSRLLIQAGTVEMPDGDLQDVVEFYALRAGAFSLLGRVPYGHQDLAQKP